MSQEQPRRPESQQEPIKYGDILDTSAQPVATRNDRGGGVGHNDLTNVAGDQGVAITEMDLPGRRIITESVGGQVVGQYSEPVPLAPISTFERGNITIGEALEATALTSGHKPVDYSDAAAIQAAEVRATGRTNIVPGGVAAAAQSAATRNARTTKEEDKTKLGDILSDATAKLPADKPVTRRDAEGVIGAELRNDPNLTTRPGGVAASVAAAARLNQTK
uniref:SMP domain-containing protein n=1 Tax=Davidia involucrata TaxID=16924 RepID=A0A5B7C3R7_DAVIN